MKGIADSLFVVGGFELFGAPHMFGEIGVAAGIGAVTALLAGAGFFQLDKRLPPSR